MNKNRIIIRVIFNSNNKKKFKKSKMNYLIPNCSIKINNHNIIIYTYTKKEFIIKLFKMKLVLRLTKITKIYLKE
jgi:hypothetical protein